MGNCPHRDGQQQQQAKPKESPVACPSHITKTPTHNRYQTSRLIELLSYFAVNILSKPSEPGLRYDSYYVLFYTLLLKPFFCYTELIIFELF